MASRSHTLYIGVTGDLLKHVFQHKWKEHVGFTAKYNCDRLVWFEAQQEISRAIAREKELKGWRRAKKIALIESLNPAWTDLSREWYDCEPADYRLSTRVGPNGSIGSNRNKKQPQILRCAQDDSVFGG
jgi:putative endonuclease